MSINFTSSQNRYKEGMSVSQMFCHFHYKHCKYHGPLHHKKMVLDPR
jgi:hypothetical protein